MQRLNPGTIPPLVAAQDPKKKSGGLLSAVLTLLTLASALTTSLPKSPSCEKSHQGQTPEETSDLLAYGRVQQSYPTISPHTPKKKEGG